MMEANNQTLTSGKENKLQHFFVFFLLLVVVILVGEGIVFWQLQEKSPVGQLGTVVDDANQVKPVTYGPPEESINKKLIGEIIEIDEMNKTMLIKVDKNENKKEKLTVTFGKIAWLPKDESTEKRFYSLRDLLNHENLEFLFHENDILTILY